jgi:hypothetical protein
VLVFGRRLPHPVQAPAIPASENQHNSRHPRQLFGARRELFSAIEIVESRFAIAGNDGLDREHVLAKGM